MQVHRHTSFIATTASVTPKTHSTSPHNHRYQATTILISTQMLLSVHAVVPLVKRGTGMQVATKADMLNHVCLRDHLHPSALLDMHSALVSPGQSGTREACSVDHLGPRKLLPGLIILRNFLGSMLISSHTSIQHN